MGTDDPKPLMLSHLFIKRERMGVKKKTKSLTHERPEISLERHTKNEMFGLVRQDHQRIVTRLVFKMLNKSPIKELNSVVYAQCTVFCSKPLKTEGSKKKGE